MKKFRKITTVILSFLLALPLFACEETGTTEPPVGPTTPPAEEPTGEVEFFDDGGKYDAIIDKAEYSWSDSDGLLDGAFSDGATKKTYATFSSLSIGDGSVVGVYKSTTISPQMSVLSGGDLLNDNTVNQDIRNGVKGSDDSDKVMDGLEESNFLKIQSEGEKFVELNIKPQCTLQEFCEADFMSFKICFYNEEGKAGTTDITEGIYFNDRQLLRMFRCTWYEIKIPLSLYFDGYEDKAALYDSLMGDAALSVVGRNATNEFVTYISDIKLGVDEIDETLGRNLTSLTQTATFLEKSTCTTNTWVYWATTEKVRRLDESDRERQLIKYSYENNDGLNIAVIPTKKLEQIQQYDYVYVTMYIETENPFPIEVGINGSYQNSAKKANVVIKGMSQNSVLVSANKWITYKIPVKGYLEKFYGRLQLNRVYTAANIPYVYYQNAMPLFFVNGEYINGVDAEAKTEVYGMNVYVSRIFLVKE